ncbi:MAG: hypothetical protein V7746_14080 [Halioglobus sp.]
MTSARSRFPLARGLKFVLLGAATLVLVLLVLFVTVFSLVRNNTERLAGLIEVVGSTVLQRELEIGELLDADLGWDTYLLATDVSLSNPAGSQEPDFARVGRLQLRLNLPSIWRDGPIIFKQLGITDASVNIYLAADQQAASWDFWPDTEAVDVVALAQDALEEADDNDLETVFPVLFLDGKILRSRLKLIGSEQEVVAELAAVSLKETAPDQPVVLDIDGSVNNIPLTVDGSFSPSSSLITLKNMEIGFAIGWGKLQVDARGSIADLANLAGPDLQLKIKAASARPLLDILGVPGTKDGPMEFDGKVTDAGPGVEIDFNGYLGQLNLTLAGKLGKPRAFDDVDLRFKLSGSSMAEAASLFELPGFPDQPYAVSAQFLRFGTALTIRGGEFRAGEGHLAWDSYFPDFPQIDNWEASLKGEEFNLALIGLLLKIPDVPAITYSVAGKLSATDEGIEFVNLSLYSAEGNLTAKGIIGEAPEFFGTRISVDLAGEQLSQYAPWFGLSELPAIPYQISANVALDMQGWKLEGSSFSSGGVVVAASGKIKRLSADSELDLAVSLSSSNLRSSLEKLGYQVAGLMDYALETTATVSGTVDKLYLDQFTAISGDSRLHLSGELGDIVSAKSIELMGELESPDILKLLPAIASKSKGSLPMTVQGAVVLTEDIIAVKNVQGRLSGASVNLNSSINLLDIYKNSYLQVQADGPSLADILGHWLERPIPNVPFQISVDVNLTEGQLLVDKLVASLGDARLDANFEVDNAKELTNAKGVIDFSGPDSSNLAKLLGLDIDVLAAPYHLKVNLSKSPDSLKLDPVKLDWGKSDYAGVIEVRLADIPEVNVTLHSDYISLVTVLPDVEALAEEEAKRAEVDKDPRKPAAARLTAEQLAERVIPNDKLDLSWLHQFNASIEYSADVLHFREDATTAVNVSFSIIDGTLTSREIAWEGKFSEGKADLMLQATDTGANADIYLDIKRLPLLLLLGGVPKHNPDAIYRARLRTHGDSLKSMAKNAKGAIAFSGGGGRLDNNSLDLIMGDFFEEIFNRLNPFSDTDPYTSIRCHAGAATIANGTMKLNPGLVIRTGKMDIASGGSLNLNNEKLNLDFNTKSRKGIGISASKAITPYFKIAGTLAYPSLALNVEGAAVSGGVAVATGGLSILAEGMWDRWVATARNPCESVINRVIKDKKGDYQELLLGLESVPAP